jgi:hypothetical protein
LYAGTLRGTESHLQRQTARAGLKKDNETGKCLKVFLPLLACLVSNSTDITFTQMEKIILKMVIISDKNLAF